MLAVLFGLGSALSWGTADFLGGLKNRTVPLMAVALGSQFAGLPICFVVIALTRSTPPDATAIAYAALAGGANAVALVTLYRALASGQMGIVAPIAGMSAVVPLAIGLARGDQPSALQSIGMLVALAGILLVSRRVDGERRPVAGSAAAHAAHDVVRRRRSLSIVLALVAAAAIGGNLLGIGAAIDHDRTIFPVMWILAVSHAVSFAILLAAALAAGRVSLPRRSDRPVVGLLGALDLGANVLYAAATRQALIGVAAVLASLHSVVTVLMARRLLGERLLAMQHVGVVMAVSGACLIAAG
jgi:drug/metabolite transporter (DMT)-like permease